MRMKPTLFTLAIVMLITIVSCDNDDNNNIVREADRPDLEFYGLTNDNRLILYNANAAQTELATTTLTGFAGGEQARAIDFRPATGQLYVLTSASKIYTANIASGVCTAIGANAFTPALSGDVAGFDFNPTVDRIRLVTSSGQNLRLHPETGAVAATDMAINPASSAIGAVAYDNSFAGATSTTLYDIDISAKVLFKQDPPNDGKLVEIGALKVDQTITDAGFDISSDNAVALAALTNDSESSLYTIDITTGEAGLLGKTSMPLLGIAIPTFPVGYAVDMSNNLQIINLATVGSPVSKPITGLASEESILGIDMRPATGQLYALGSTSRLYTVNLSSGAATAVGDAPLTTSLNGTSFGFDFNPTVDRIRVVSNMGQNLRLHPVTGAVAAVDASLNPGTPSVSAGAYTNNYPGATTTLLYDIDCGSDRLLTQVPPNDGVLVDVGPLGIDVDPDNGFDIGGNSNQAFGIFTSGGSTKIYRINLTNGTATALADYPNKVRGFTVGLGF